MALVNLKKKEKYYIPLEFSISHWGSEKMTEKKQRELSEFGLVQFDAYTKPKEDKEKAKQENNDKYMPKEDEIMAIGANMPEFMQILSNVLAGLADTRAKETKTWYSVLNVCINLCEVYGLDEEAVIDLFDVFSQRGDDRYIGSRDAIANKFEALKGKGKGYMGLLWCWLKQDDMPAFKRCIREFYSICPPPKKECISINCVNSLSKPIHMESLLDFYISTSFS